MDILVSFEKREPDILAFFLRSQTCISLIKTRGVHNNMKFVRQIQLFILLFFLSQQKKTVSYHLMICIILPFNDLYMPSWLSTI